MLLVSLDYFKDNSAILVLVIVVVVVGLLALIPECIKKIIHSSQKSKVEQITIGMPEARMLSIMGRKYNKSLLKNGRVKYEWRLSEAQSVGTYGRGVSVRKYSGVRKVAIYCKDGVVEEVKPYNV